MRAGAAGRVWAPSRAARGASDGARRSRADREHLLRVREAGAPRAARRRACARSRRRGPRRRRADVAARACRRGAAWRRRSGGRRRRRPAAGASPPAPGARAPSCFISRPTVSATAPPMPASTSSKISVPAPSSRVAAARLRDDRDRERDARQLAARGHLGERPRRAAGVAGDAGTRPTRAPNDCGAVAAAASATSKRPPAMPSCCIACVTARGELRRGARRARRLTRARLGVVGRARRASARCSQRVEVGRGVERLQLGLPLRPAAPAARPAAGGSGAPGRSRPTCARRAARSRSGSSSVRSQVARAACARRPAAAPARRAAPRSRRLERARRSAATSSSASTRARGERLGARVGVGRSRRARLRAASISDCALRQARVLGVELGPFVGAGRELVDLADLPGQALALALEVALLRARASASAASRVAPARPTRAASGAVSMPRVGVEQRAHRRPARVRLCQACWPWMSTSCSAASRSCATVAALPLIQARLLPCASMRAAQQQRRVAVAGVEAGLGEPGAERRRRVELGADLGARRAFAHDAGVAAAAERELQRVDQDRLAGAGLAGQHGEAARRARARARATMTKSRIARRCSMVAALASGALPVVSSAACRAASRSSSSRADAGSAPGAPSGARGSRSPCSRLVSACMSKFTLASRPATISIADLAGVGHARSAGSTASCGAIGTSTQPAMPGCRIGPPADSA